ncbi:hypothetical protein KC323_g5344 [Hortaea werneckii]|uniref:F-box domain-containing protein n=1 Tax=Hortaea werneckii TaxID=91943 RepID=A0A3M7GWC3_HORWE|nr:hypothetical protein KC323_g5344 [Hortaea werneckii]KAI7349038.1 hypothetical protein KC320_g6315 [Hortaea werneckii]RMZ05461.1 hypothetical protein D0862_04980 [Hortaea werneckii]
MDRLPEEVILHIITYLTLPENLALQAVSSRFLILARDDSIWKQETFTHSRAEALRRRQQLLDAQDARLAELRNAVTALPGSDLTAWDVSQLRGSSQPRAASDPQAEAKAQRQRAFANWEPAFPDERLDYYDEFIRRHAPIRVGWLDLPKAQQNADREEVREATGIGTLDDPDNGSVRNLVAPLDDGSICIWDVSRRSTVDYAGGGKLLGQSTPGLLTGQHPNSTAESHNIMTETGAVECVSIDNEAKKGYFAVQSLLHEVDLNTLQLTSTKQYPFPITALSKCEANVPLTVGTNWTIHLHDPRDPAFSATSGEDPSGDRAELIGGSPYSHATLAQPGPLSILHEPATTDIPNPNSIWVAGRFTSLLNYDRRFFPKLLGTIFSGARIASLSLLPFPLVPRNLDLLRNPSVSIHELTSAKKSPGATLVAAAEYKGKGSLEFYGLSSHDEASPAVARRREPHYQNRQTASASKLLAAAPHGGTVVFADGDGNLKWHERDGFSVVRTFNINESLPSCHHPRDLHPSEGRGAGGGGGDGSTPRSNHGRSTEPSPGTGDIVQKILPTNPITASASCAPNTHKASQSNRNPSREDLPSSPLLLWTGDGRIGMLGYGHRDPLQPRSGDEDPETSEHKDGAREISAEAVEQRAREDAERQYGMAMRRALERNADEVRFVRGLGMGFMRP